GWPKSSSCPASLLMATRERRRLLGWKPWRFGLSPTASSTARWSLAPWFVSCKAYSMGHSSRHEGVTIGPKMLARIAKRTGLAPEGLYHWTVGFPNGGVASWDDRSFCHPRNG